jgi:hypothetical protein
LEQAIARGLELLSGNATASTAPLDNLGADDLANSFNTHGVVLRALGDTVSGPCQHEQLGRWAWRHTCRCNRRLTGESCVPPGQVGARRSFESSLDLQPQNPHASLNLASLLHYSLCAQQTGSGGVQDAGCLERATELYRNAIAQVRTRG